MAADTGYSRIQFEEEGFGNYLLNHLQQANLQEKTFQPGENLFEENSQGDSAYFVVDGKVRVFKTSDEGREKTFGHLGGGSLIGEMALFDEPIRSASVIATEPTRAYEIGRGDLTNLVKQDPEIAFGLLGILSHRLRLTNRQVAQMEQVQEVNTKIIMGQENERKRLAREIHDGPCNQFADYLMRVQICEKLLEKDPSKLTGEFSGLKEVLNKGLNKLKDLVYTLNPKDISELGLEEVIRKFIKRIEGEYTFKVAFHCDQIDAASIDFPTQNTVFCLVQEAFNNISRQPSTKTVEIALTKADGKLVLKIADDGEGYDMEKMKQGYYKQEVLGFTSMKERVQLLNGDMQMLSKHGVGTLLEFKIPVH